MIGNIPRFDESLAGISQSFSGLSGQLSTDSTTARAAASESDANRAAFAQITDKLRGMFERISAASDSVEDLSRLPGYREMEAPHKAVHDEARQAVERYRSDDIAGALAALTRMEDANLTVMAGMKRILQRGE